MGVLYTNYAIAQGEFPEVGLTEASNTASVVFTTGSANVLCLSMDGADAASAAQNLAVLLETVASVLREKGSPPAPPSPGGPPGYSASGGYSDIYG